MVEITVGTKRKQTTTSHALRITPFHPFFQRAFWAGALRRRGLCLTQIKTETSSRFSTRKRRIWQPKDRVSLLAAQFVWSEERKHGLAQQPGGLVAPLSGRHVFVWRKASLWDVAFVFHWCQTAVLCVYPAAPVRREGFLLFLYFSPWSPASGLWVPTTLTPAEPANRT